MFRVSPISSAVLVIVFLAACSKKKDEGQVEDLSLLPKVERIQLEDLEGNPVTLEELQGQRVFLNFWATWCKPCIAEMPSIDRAAETLESEDYVFLLASDENIDRIRRFAQKNPYSFQYVQLKTSVYALDVMALPTTFVIDRSGEIVFEKVGAEAWDNASILEELRSL